MSHSTPVPPVVRRTLTIAGAIAAGVGLVGFLSGPAEPVTVERFQPTAPQALPGNVLAAPSYREVDSRMVGPNRQWISTFDSLKQDRPSLFDPVVRTAAMKDAALRDRLRTRAFEGAPPVVPHRIEHQSASSCLVCHQNGLKLGDRIATRISHPHYTNCLQCHVEQVGSLPSTVVVHSPSGHVEPITNTFAGLVRLGPGDRAMPHAPPMIPHTTQMRNDCASCHGLVARPGLRTTHPWLNNCTQCHVAAAEPWLTKMTALQNEDAQ